MEVDCCWVPKFHSVRVFQIIHKYDQILPIVLNFYDQRMVFKYLSFLWNSPEMKLLEETQSVVLPKKKSIEDAYMNLVFMAVPSFSEHFLPCNQEWTQWVGKSGRLKFVERQTQGGQREWVSELCLEVQTQNPVSTESIGVNVCWEEITNSEDGPSRETELFWSSALSPLHTPTPPLINLQLLLTPASTKTLQMKTILLRVLPLVWQLFKFSFFLQLVVWVWKISIGAFVTV